MALNERNREKILAFDKKYKREIYRGARSAAGWANWLKTEYVGVLSGDNGVIGNKGADGSLLDASGSREGGGLSLERIGNEENLGGEEDSGATAKAKNQTFYLYDGERIVGSFNRETGEINRAKGATVSIVIHGKLTKETWGLSPEFPTNLNIGAADLGYKRLLVTFCRVFAAKKLEEVES